MLILDRDSGESIELGDGITFTVLRVEGDSVRVGIEAPRDVPVRRGELDDDAERAGA